jgi:hypothetical protein
LGNGSCAKQGKTNFEVPIEFKNYRNAFVFRLVYYLHPTDAELRKLAGLPQPKPKPKPKEGDNKRGKHKRKWAEEPVEDKTFTVPRNLDLQVRLF